MKYLSFYTKFAFLFLLAFSMASCGGDDDPVDPGIEPAEAPTISLGTDGGAIGGDTNLLAGLAFSVAVSATAGTADMASLTVLLDDEELDEESMSLPDNPTLLEGTEVSGFTKTFTITLPDEPGDYTYTFEVADADGLKDEVALNISAFAAPDNEPPVVTLGTDAGLVWEDGTNLFGETTFEVAVLGEMGSSEMVTLTVYIDGEKVALEDLSLPGNPMLLIDAQGLGFNTGITISLPDTPGDYTYTFEVEDASGLIGAVTITITTVSNVAEPPMIFANSGTDFLTEAGSLVNIPIQVSAGTADLFTLSVWQDGALMDSARLYFDGVEFISNPLGLIESEFQGFGADITIRVHDEENVTANYIIRVEDDNGLTADLPVTITTEEVFTGTPTTFQELGVLFNQAGPSGTGGLDLDNALGTGSIDASAEIRDLGSDFNLPADQNWRQTIAGVNGAQIRRVGSGVPETFTFASATTVEAIEGAYNDSDAGSEFFVSQSDMFIVAANGKYYLLECTNIDIKPAVGDNTDSYTFNIKY